ncbi:hypothetical protein ACQP1W_37945 [Spirillospora sp. CA-255316]
MRDRLRLVRAFQRGPARRFERGFARWNVIEAVIELFIEHGMGAPGTWASYTDAAIVEGVQRGLALAGGRSGGDHGNPGARLWARYLTDLRAGRLKDKATHNAAWGNAEQASTEWGIRPANNPATPTVPELTLFTASESYRQTLRNEPTTRPLLRALNQPQLLDCYDWLTDVTNRKPIRNAGNVLLRLSRTPGNPQLASDVLTGLATTYPECTRGARHRLTPRG